MFHFFFSKCWWTAQRDHESLKLIPSDTWGNHWWNTEEGIWNAGLDVSIRSFVFRSMRTLASFDTRTRERTVLDRRTVRTLHSPAVQAVGSFNDGTVAVLHPTAGLLETLHVLHIQLSQLQTANSLCRAEGTHQLWVSRQSAVSLKHHLDQIPVFEGGGGISHHTLWSGIKASRTSVKTSDDRNVVDER